MPGPYQNWAEELYNGDEWVKRREDLEYYERWFSGAALKQTSGRASSDDTSKEELLYPLQINTVRQFCQTHRSMMVGIVDSFTSSPAKIIVTGKDKDKAKTAQEFIDDVWYDSRGAATISEAALRIQIDGGRAFYLAYEPLNPFLRHGFRVIPYSPGSFHGVYVHGDPFNLVKGYIGYMLDAKLAKSIYGVDVSGYDTVLFMEYWSRTQFRVTVNGYVPQNTDNFKFEGPNPYGIVPMVYMPHTMDGKFYGVGHVDDLIGLTKEKNTRAADLGDAVRDSTHPTMWMRNVDSVPKEIAIQTDDEGRAIKWAVNLGQARNLPNSHDPNLEYATPPNVTEPANNYVTALNSELRQQAFISPVITGSDDSASGRITGTTTSQRMYPTVAHCHQERIAFTAGLVSIAQRLLIMANRRGAEGITPDMPMLRMDAEWPPHIPIEQSERVTNLNSRLSAGGISLASYLREIGEWDPETERAAILGDIKDKLTIQSSMVKEKEVNNEESD
jgi:hypothetical protein